MVRVRVSSGVRLAQPARLPGVVNHSMGFHQALAAPVPFAPVLSASVPSAPMAPGVRVRMGMGGGRMPDCHRRIMSSRRPKMRARHARIRACTASGSQTGAGTVAVAAPSLATSSARVEEWGGIGWGPCVCDQQ